MRVALLIAAVFVIPLFTFCQIINPGFEEIRDTESDFPEPVGWAVAGLDGARLVEDAHGGSYALRVWTYYNYQQGQSCNGELKRNQKVSPINCGNKITGKPEELKGFYKYVHDRGRCEDARVEVKMFVPRSGGFVETVGTGQLKLSATDDWAEFVVPITYNPTKPDPEMVMISFFSGTGLCGSGGNCCYLTVDDLWMPGMEMPASNQVAELMGDGNGNTDGETEGDPDEGNDGENDSEGENTMTASTVINAGFEEIKENSMPNGWFMESASGMRLDPESQSGSYAIRVWTRNDYLQGIAFNGDPEAEWLDNPDDGGTPISIRPAKLEGYYKSTDANDDCEKPRVEVFLTQKNEAGQNATIATGFLDLKPADSYKAFTIHIDYVDHHNYPDRALIRLVSGHGACSTADGNCCFLFVDDLNFTGEKKAK